jgi:hypothetical protein
MRCGFSRREPVDKDPPRSAALLKSAAAPGGRALARGLLNPLGDDLHRACPCPTNAEINGAGGIECSIQRHASIMQFVVLSASAVIPLSYLNLQAIARLYKPMQSTLFWIPANELIFGGRSPRIARSQGKSSHSHAVQFTTMPSARLSVVAPALEIIFGVLHD